MVLGLSQELWYDLSYIFYVVFECILADMMTE